MTELTPPLFSLAVIAAGAVLAGVARLVLPASRRLTWSTTIVAAVVGASLAGLLLDALAADQPLIVEVAVAVAGAVVAVASADAALVARERRRAKGVPGSSVRELIAAGEADRVEFKSTARWNLRTGAKDGRLETEVALTVAGFMNARGGTLLVGVADDGSIVGLASDYPVVPRGDRDGYEAWLRSMLAERLGRAVTADVGVCFEQVDGRDVCRIDVAPAERPVFLAEPGGARTADFYLRVGNTTRRLLTDEALEYAAARWP